MQESKYGACTAIAIVESSAGNREAYGEGHVYGRNLIEQNLVHSSWSSDGLVWSSWQRSMNPLPILERSQHIAFPCERWRPLA